jgi:hypothetical protein
MGDEMPRLAEAAVALTGTVFGIEHLKDFETKQPDGSVRIIVAAHGEGFANVKLRSADVALIGGVPAPMSNVSWMVRYGAYSRGDSAESFQSFVRPVNENDLDMLHTAALNPVSAAPAK